MRQLKLTKKQKNLLFEWATANPDLVMKHKPTDEIDGELYERIDSINPCEIFYQNVNHFIDELLNNDKIDVSNEAVEKARARREKEVAERIKNRSFVDWVDVGVLDDVISQALVDKKFEATEQNKKDLWLGVLDELWNLADEVAERERLKKIKSDAKEI